MRHLLFALLVLSAPAQAGPDRVSILLGSAHPGSAGFDGRNPGIFLTWEDRGGLDLSLGAYRNSYGRASVAATASLPALRWREGGASLFLGAAHYPEDGRRFRFHAGDIVPLAGLQLRHGSLFAQIMPGDGRVADAVIAFGLTFPLTH